MALLRLRIATALIAALSVLLPAPPTRALPMPGDPAPTDSAVDQMTGSARVGVPIEVPPGTGGFSPRLAMTYASRAGDSPYGTGFSLSLGPVPLGEVRVSTRFLPKGTDIVYELDGEELAPNGNRYHTATSESFKRITREGTGPTAGWLVELPDGTKARYGQDANSRFPTMGTPTRWLLSAISDRNGNTVRISYADLNAGTPSVIGYSYQGSATNAPAIGGLREIRFVYESRPDPIYDFMGYEFRRITQRLREIQVVVKNLSGTAKVFRRYSVKYTSNAVGEGRSKVSSVQAFGTDCTDLTRTPEAQTCAGMPPSYLTYTVLGAKADGTVLSMPQEQTGSDDATGVPVATFFRDTPGGPLIDAGVRQADVNGDGLPDLVQAFRGTDGVVQQNVYLNNGSGWSSDTSNSWTTSLRSISFQDKKMQRSGCTIVVANKGAEKAIFKDRRPLPAGSPSSDSAYPQSWQLVDLNADGYADLIASYAVGYGYSCNTIAPGTRILEVWLNDRQGGWARNDLVSNDLSSYRAFGALAFLLGPVVLDYYPSFGEFDGDGFADLAVGVPTVTTESCVDLLNRPLPTAGGIDVLGGSVIERSPFSGFSGTERVLPSLGATHTFTFTCPEMPFTVDEPIAATFADLNRDGLTDYAFTLHFGSFDFVRLGKRGGGFCSPSDCPESARYILPVAPLTTVYFGPDQGFHQTYDAGVRLTDINGDGWTDVVQGLLEVRSTGPTSIRRAFLYDPSATSSSTWKEDPRFAPAFDLVKADFTATSDPNVPLVTVMDHQFIDINADGADDVLYAGGKKISKSTLPDLIASFNNGRGGTIGFAHETEVFQRTTADFNQAVNLALNVLALESILPGELGVAASPPYSTRHWTKSPVVVVETAKNMPEVGAADAVTKYTYDAPGFSLENRTGLGFGGVLVERPDGTFTRMLFAQQRGVSGMLVDAANLDSALAPLSEARMVYAVRDGSMVPGSTAGVPVGRRIATKSRVVYGANDPLPLGQFTQETTNVYDDTYGYNFVSSVTEKRNSGQLIKTSTPTSTSTFINATTYLPGLPSRIEEKDGAARILSRTDFGYDTAAGRVTKMTSLIQARDNPVSPQNRIIDIGYDTYGNVRSTTTSAVAGMPLVTEFVCYDGDTSLGTGTCPNPTSSLNSHALVVGARDVLGKLTTFVPNPTTGLPERTVAFNGDISESIFDAFGRITERALDPVRGTVPRTVLERRVYNDVYFEGLFRPYVETYVRTGNGSEEIRSAMLPDGFGRVDRTTKQTPSGYAGRVITRDPVNRTVRETFVKACTDGYCRDIPATAFPATIVTSDPLGRVTKVEEWGDAQTRNAISLKQFERVVRSQPMGFTPPGASTYFDGELSKNAKGDLARRILDGADRVVWSEECGNTLAPTAASLVGVTCNSADVSYFVYDATGERTRLYDPIAYPSGPFDNTNRYLAFAFDTLGRRISSQDPDGGTTKSVFNVLSQKIQVTNARNKTTLFTNDLLGRVTKIDRPDSEPDSTLKYSDELSSQGNRELAQVTNASAGISPTQEDFQYDPFDNLSYRKAGFTVATTATALVTRFQSDLLGRRTRIDYADANTSVGYTYVGNVLTKVCELNTSGVCAVDYLSKVEYDEIGREFKAFGPNYTPMPNNTPFQTTNYSPLTYRVSHQDLSTVQSRQGNADARFNFDYSYDALGNVTTVHDLNPTSDGTLAPFSEATYAYDSRNRLMSRKLGGVEKFYTYDRLGNLTGNLLTSQMAAANQIYDDPQLPHAIKTAGATSFTYDADGNMKSRGTQVLGYNAENKLTCLGTSSGCTTIQIGYDAAGLRATELTSAGATFYVGDLFEYQRTPGAGTAHIYALGREVAFKKIPAVTLRTDGSLGGMPFDEIPRFIVLALLTAAGGLVVLALFRSDAPSGWVRRPGYATGLFALAGIVALPPHTWAAAFPPAPSGAYRRWLSSDPIQSALYVYDEQGRRASKRIFEPFGGIFDEVNSPSEISPRRFATHLFDAGLGLYYMKARFYDPNVGRFTSLDRVIRDPDAIESVNPYSYVENNPVNSNDPTGTFSVGPDGDIGFFPFGISIPASFPSLGGGTRTTTAVFGPVTVTITTTINTPQSRLDRALGGREPSLARRLLGTPDPGTKVITGITGDVLLDGTGAGPVVPGLIFENGGSKPGAMTFPEQLVLTAGQEGSFGVLDQNRTS